MQRNRTALSERYRRRADPYLNMDLVREAPQLLPAGSELVVIEGGSHVVYIEKPYYKEFQDKLITFLGK